MPMPDAEAQIAELAEKIRPHLQVDSALIGIHSGGVWIAERLHALLGLTAPLGSVDVSFYRDDYGRSGLRPGVRPSTIPFEVDDRPLILVDDVLFTGRTTRAALNEIFDYGRPARVDLAVLADRGGRQLPVAASWCIWDAPVTDRDTLVLARDAEQRLVWRLEADA